MNQALFTLFNLTIALVVPFVSVWFAISAARRLAERETRRRDVQSLFLRINEHADRYRLAMVQFHRAAFEPVPVVNRDRARAVAAHEFWAVHTAFNGDILLLYFIFGDAAQPLTDVLHSLMAMYEDFNFDTAPDFAGFNERASLLTHRAAGEMAALWESLEAG